MHTNGSASHRESHGAAASLIEALGSPDAFTREQARGQLEELGIEASENLVEALRQPNRLVRWEAARALRQIEDPGAAPALVEALEDEELGVSWAASEALLALGKGALPPLLEALSERPYSPSLYLRAHHVLRLLTSSGEESLERVLTALEGVTLGRDQVPLAAYKAIQAMACGGACEDFAQGSR